MSWIEEPAQNIVGQFDLSTLNIDEAFLNFTSESNIPLWLYSLSSACYSCPYTRVSDVSFTNGVNRDLKIDTYFQHTYRFRTEGTNFTAPRRNDEFAFCEFGNDPVFQEFGVYNILIKDDDKCTVSIAAEPVNIYLPLLLACFVYLILISAICVTSKIKKRWTLFQKSSSRNPSSSSDRLVNQSQPPPVEPVVNRVQPTSNPNGGERALQTLSSVSNPPPERPRQRLRSLDAFRGICIVLMIFVNFGGAKYYFFEHAVWDLGFTVADLVFPWFLWIMGVCIPIGVKSQVKRGIPRLKILKTILIRSLKLIGLGLLYNTLHGPAQFGSDAKLRILGILQRLGICYLVCGTLVLMSMTVNFSKPGGRGGKIKAAIQDLSILWISWIPILVILILHFLITFYLPVPGCPTGYLGPGGYDLGNNATLASHCIGGAAGYIDLKILTTKHMYNFPTAREIFHTGPYDPEGILGILTSVVQVWLGVQTGATMLVYPRPMSRLKRWGIWAIFTGATGTVLCCGQMTGGWIPLNKNLWSISYVLVTSCFANILLSILYFLIDIKKWWSGSPFYEPGMNSILLYMGHGILGSSLPWHWSDGLMRTHGIKLAENLWATSLWTLLGLWLHSKKLYWSV